MLNKSLLKATLLMAGIGLWHSSSKAAEINVNAGLSYGSGSGNYSQPVIPSGAYSNFYNVSQYCRYQAWLRQQIAMMPPPPPPPPINPFCLNRYWNSAFNGAANYNFNPGNMLSINAHYSRGF